MKKRRSQISNQLWGRMHFQHARSLVTDIVTPLDLNLIENIMWGQQSARFKTSLHIATGLEYDWWGAL